MPKRLSALLNTSGLPAVLEPFSRTPVDPGRVTGSGAGQQSGGRRPPRPSVVKIRSVAPSCQKVLEGSGFVISPDRVMTNAHVVAGSNSVPGLRQRQSASTPRWCPMTRGRHRDPGRRRLACRRRWPSPTPRRRPAPDVVVLGYPGGGNFTATPARIREVIKLSGPDIYRDPQPVTRDVYTIRANVEQGNSGGPLIDLNGRVLGVVFGAAVDDPDTGFVLTADEVASSAFQGSATPNGSAPAPASADPWPVHVLEESHQVPVDFLGCFFVAEMSCAGNGYVASVRRVALRAVDRVGQHVGIRVTA